MWQWAPLLRLGLGLHKDESGDMSIPELVDHVDWWIESREVGQGG